MNDLFQTSVDLLYWLAISAGIGVPLMFCAYMTITPTQRICASWQNYRVSRSPHRALKDRHFRHLPGRVRKLKIVCFFAFFVFLWLALQQFHVDVAAIIGRYIK
jgi:hypothetical protein